MTATAFCSIKSPEQVPRKRRSSMLMRRRSSIETTTSSSTHSVEFTSCSAAPASPPSMSLDYGYGSASPTVSFQHHSEPMQASNTKRRYQRRGSKCPSMMLMMLPSQIDTMQLNETTTPMERRHSSPPMDPLKKKKCTLSILTEALNLSAATALQDGYKNVAPVQQQQSS